MEKMMDPNLIGYCKIDCTVNSKITKFSKLIFATLIIISEPHKYTYM